MVTPLVLSSLHLHDRLTNSSFFPCIFLIDRETNEFKIQPTFQKRLLFYNLNILGIFIFFPPLIRLLLKYTFDSTSTIPGIAIVANLFILCFGALYFTICIPTYISGNEVVQYFATVLNYSSKRAKFNETYKFTGNFLTFILQHFNMVNQQTKKFLKGDKSADFLGLLTSNHVVYGWTLVILLPVVTVYLNIDALNYFIEDYIPLPLPHMRSVSLNVTLILTRYFILLLMAFEAFRVNLITISVCMIHQTVYITAVQDIQRKNPWLYCGATFRIYRELRVLLNTGCWFVQPLIAGYMATGFLLSVLANCYNFIGWRFLRWSVYLPFTPFSFVLILIIAKSVSLTANIHKVSTEMIKYNWVVEAGNCVKMEGKYGSFKKYRRILATQKAIAFRSGSMAVVDIETERNYIAYIIQSTTNLFLVFNANIKNMSPNTVLV